MQPNSKSRFSLISCVLLMCVPSLYAQDLSSKLSSPPFEIHYAPADEATAQSTLQILQEASGEYSKELPLGNEPVVVTICPSFASFKKLAGEYGQATVSGVAQSEAGLIIIKAPYLLTPDDDYKGMVRHELIHVLLARNTDPVNVPRWFNEGIAMLISREIRWGGMFHMARMYTYGNVIPYGQLNFAFATRGDERTFGDAYAEAYSMTRYLHDRIGQDQFWQLVMAMEDLNFDDALQIYAGLTPVQLFQAWQSSLWKLALAMWLLTGVSAFQIMALLLILAYWRKYRRGRRILRQWDEEEQELEPDPEPEALYQELDSDENEP